LVEYTWLEMTISSYKELVVWQKSIELTELIYRITSKFPKSELYGIMSQMRRASVSIPSQIAEGYGRQSKKQYRHFLSIAFGSAMELETQLILAKKLKLAKASELNKPEETLEEVLKMLNKLISKLSSNS